MKLNFRVDQSSCWVLLGGFFGIIIATFIGMEFSFIASFLAGFAGLFFLTCKPDTPNVLPCVVFSFLSAGFVVLSSWLNVIFSVFETEEMQSRVIYSFFFTLIVIPFFMAYQHKKRLNTDYKLLHQYAWDRPFIYCGAWVFVGVLFLVFFLWSSLFKLVGITIFEQVFENAYFIAAAIGGGFALAVALLGQHAKIVDTTKQLVETLLAVLAPVIMSIMLLFLMILPFSGVSIIFNTGSASYIMASIVVLGVVIINAIIRDERVCESRLLQWCAKIIAITLPFFAFIALWAVYIRFSQYGLTQKRIDAFILLCFAALYSCSYAWFVLASWWQDWAAVLRRVNIVNALVVLVVCSVMMSPLIDTNHISIWQQKRAFLSGQIKIENFDFAALKFKMGPKGLEALEDIRLAAPTYQAPDLLLGYLKKVDQASNYYNSDGVITAKTDDFMSAIDTYPANTELPAGFMDYILVQETWQVESCLKNKDITADRCVFILADMIGDAKPEVFIFYKNINRPDFFYSIKNGDWKKSYNVDLSRVDNVDNNAFFWSAFKAAIAAKTIKTVPADLKMLKIGDVFVKVLPYTE
jgi:hypothetical protein